MAAIDCVYQQATLLCLIALSFIMQVTFPLGIENITYAWEFYESAITF